MIRGLKIEILVVALLAWPAVSLADVLRVAPTVSSVLPESAEGESRVVLKFDLSGMRAGENRGGAWSRPGLGSFWRAGR